MGSVQTVIQAGVQENQQYSNDNVRPGQRHHGTYGQNAVGNEAQLEVGNDIDQNNGYDLANHEIHPVKLTEHGAVGIQEQGVQEHGIYAHENVLALIGKVCQIVAIHPDNIVRQREDGDFQQRLRHPDKALHILKSAPAQFFHSISTHPFPEMSVRNWFSVGILPYIREKSKRMGRVEGGE